MKFSEVLEIATNTPINVSFFTRKCWDKHEWITLLDELNGMCSLYFLKHFENDVYGVWLPSSDDLFAEDWDHFDWENF